MALICKTWYNVGSTQLLSLKLLLINNLVHKLKGVASIIRAEYVLRLRNKTCSLCRHSVMKTEVNVWENSRADLWKCSPCFFLLRVKHNFLAICIHCILISWRQLTWLLTSFSCFIALWKDTYRPIKTHVLSEIKAVKCSFPFAHFADVTIDIDELTKQQVWLKVS